MEMKTLSFLAFTTDRNLTVVKINKELVQRADQKVERTPVFFVVVLFFFVKSYLLETYYYYYYYYYIIIIIIIINIIMNIIKSWTRLMLDF